MKPKNKSKPTRPPVAGGTYLAVCVYSIDIGEQYCTYQDKSADYKDQVVIGFELCGFTYEENGMQKPYDLSKTFTASMHQKAALRNFVQAWEGHELSESDVEAFDTRDLLGRTCMVNVILKENGFNDITGVFRIPAGIPEPAPTMPLIAFDMEPWDQAAFDALPEWAQKKVKKSTQYQKEHAPNTAVTFPPIQTPGTIMGSYMQNGQGFGAVGQMPPVQNSFIQPPTQNNFVQPPVQNSFAQPPMQMAQPMQSSVPTRMQQPVMSAPVQIGTQMPVQMYGEATVPMQTTPNYAGQVMQAGQLPVTETECPI